MRGKSFEIWDLLRGYVYFILSCRQRLWQHGSMELIETHAHFDYVDFDSDREEALQRALDAGVKTIISIGTRLQSSEAAVALAEKYPQVYAVVGWHPTDCEAAPDDVYSLLKPLARHPKVVAIGETGLDYHHLPSENMGMPEPSLQWEGAQNTVQIEKDLADQDYKRKQDILFRQQLELASEFGLNVVVHQRDAFEDCWNIMKEYEGKTRGVWHCFVNDAACASRVIEIGSLVSFTGIVTFKNAGVLHDTVKSLTLESMMLETDCPYLAPVPFRGKRAEPAHVRLIAEKVAELKGVPLEMVADVTTFNARKFFKFDRR